MFCVCSDNKFFLVRTMKAQKYSSIYS